MDKGTAARNEKLLTEHSSDRLKHAFIARI